ncbi:hypothetical protein NP233_g8570 [Leucocoprinus birnbaumii]|uniref:Protein kinase domain-containing protein n=1 Tax=Leucocoprinus birnbaumii TaxID=56174 RepID=A0AAD5VMA2_9AGAR|nr:hypothetical protein NP233_g8570 [Leucocoprinus birnbaumii]
MGTSHSKSKPADQQSKLSTLTIRSTQTRDAKSMDLEDMPSDYQTASRILSELVKERSTRRTLAQLKGEEAQAMADFLNRVLEREDLEGANKKDVLHTLASLSRTAKVFPRCLRLLDVDCDFASPDYTSNFSEIYRGTYKGENVCVKAICKNKAGYTYEQLLKVHAREAILSAHMWHDNILPFYGVFLGEDEISQVCIISPWMDCGNLLDYVKSNPGVPLAPLMADMSSGLEYMHRLDILHSDLKAKNVLVSKEGRAVLADFGASHVTTATKTGTTVGDANWMAPELLAGDISNPTKDTDVWSFACTCYELIGGGAKPFYQFSNITALGKAFKDGGAFPIRPSGKHSVQDDTIWRELEKCWRLKPKKRPTAPQLLEFYSGIVPKDSLPQISRPDKGIRVDRTKIDDVLVLKLLQEIQLKASLPKRSN